MRKLLLTALFAAAASVSNAAVISVDSELATGATVPAGFVVNDLKIDFTGQLATQQLRLALTSGSIYQHPNGGDTAPTDFLAGLVPGLEFDSFITLGTARSDSSASSLIAGGAVNIGGGAAKVFSTSGVDITFAPSPGVIVNGGTDYQIARLTLSNTANGELFVYSQTLGSDALTPVGTVMNGVVSFGPIIPEPTTCVLAGLALVGAAARRRV